jgi:hypothetical protein
MTDDEIRIYLDTNLNSVWIGAGEKSQHDGV